MSLVAYGNSSDEDESENEDNTNSEINTSVIKPNGAIHKNQINANIDADNGNASSGESSTLFGSLPQPRLEHNVIEEVQDEFLTKKEIPEEKPKPKQKIKITLPSINAYQTDEDDDPGPNTSNPKKPVKASGLFSILPPPKGTPLSNTSFIPQVLQRKPNKPQPSKPLRKSPQKPQVKQVLKGTEESDDEFDDIPETFDEETWEKVCAPKKRTPKRPVEDEETSYAVASSVEIAPEPEKPYDGLDNAAFKELVGGSKRRKENVKLIDINEEDILPEKDQWLTKSLTDPALQPKYVEEDPVNPTCRRKHHITYLAQKAKANEQELQNQWAANRFNRKATQSKYGF